MSKDLRGAQEHYSRQARPFPKHLPWRGLFPQSPALTTALMRALPQSPALATTCLRLVRSLPLRALQGGPQYKFSCVHDPVHIGVVDIEQVVVTMPSEVGELQAGNRCVKSLHSCVHEASSECQQVAIEIYPEYQQAPAGAIEPEMTHEHTCVTM